MNILLTGGTGFIGSHILCALQSFSNINLSIAARRRIERLSGSVFEISDLDGLTDWSTALVGQEVVIHAAARAHIMTDEVVDPLAEYRRVNVDATLHLGQQAAAAGVQRFIFISSIKVNGEGTPFGKPFKADSLPAPEDCYGISKWEAEKGLQQLAAETGMEVVIIRPPLVYGFGVKGNFASLIKLVKKGVPLPFGAIKNRRSMVAVDNLVDLVITCINHPAAANQIFLAGDREVMSTTELLRSIAKAMGKPSRLIPIPSSFLMLVARLLGKKTTARKLLVSLEVDTSKARKILGWEPPITIEEGLRKCFVNDSLTFALTQASETKSIKKQQGVRMIRFFDFLFSLLGLVCGFPVLLLLVLIGFFDTGSPIFRQERIGRNKERFTLVKFRTMQKETSSVATHLVSSSSITKFGHFLRKTKLDELPQLWNVLKGEMSLVGPRPCLPNQLDLIDARDRRGVYSVRPGITGLAQVNEIDMSTPELLADTDAQMIDTFKLKKYFIYIFQTIVGKGRGDRVRSD